MSSFSINNIISSDQPINNQYIYDNNKIDDSKNYVFDSGASVTVVNDIKQLINIKEDLEDSERLFYTVSNLPIYAKAKGDLVIKIKNCKFTINNAYYIPGIQLNLISFNDLLNKGFLILFDNDYLFLIKKSNGKCFNIAKRDTNSNLFNNIRSKDFSV